MQQIPLFDRPDLNIIKLQKKALHSSAKASRFSREEILDRMNELASAHHIHLVSNGRLKMDTFEKWLNPNEKSRHMPMCALPVFCSVVGDISSINILALAVGAQVIGPTDLKLLKWAKAYFRARDARKTMRRIEGDLEVWWEMH